MLNRPVLAPFLKHLAAMLCWASASAAVHALPARVAVMQVSASTSQEAPALECAPLPKRAPRPSQPDADPLVIPADEEVRESLEGAELKRPAPASAGRLLNRPLPLQGSTPLRVAIWGDSHLAAAFFSQELVSLLKLAPDQVQSALLPPTMNAPGVRLPLRKACVSSHWRRELVYAHREAATVPGPGMVNLHSAQAGANLSWDFRHPSAGVRPGSLKLLYQQTAEPIEITIAIDGGAAQTLVLAQEAGPAAVEVLADGPISTLSLHLVSGSLRLHGLALPVAPSVKLQMDVFGYPGATVNAWATADSDYLSAWFEAQAYDLVLLEFGTNEGNVGAFDPVAYEALLNKAVSRWRARFPDSACMLIGPGDRGVLVRQSARGKRAKGSKAKRVVMPGKNVDLLKYSKIHASIVQIQDKVGAEYGCRAWSMLDAMGGPASAYTWARSKPALMAPDLIHFTVGGYQRLAQTWARDVGWDREAFWPR